jgi:hypothetical protein
LLSVLSDIEINRSNKISALVHFSLFSFVSRNDYSFTPHSESGGRFVFFGRFPPFWENQLIHMSLVYKLKLSRSISAHLNYDFQYTKYPEPQKIAFYMNNFKAGLSFLF